MRDAEALDILRANGYTVGAPDINTGRVRVWIPATNQCVDVTLGRELHEMAEGKLTFEDIRTRHETKTAAGTA